MSNDPDLLDEECRDCFGTGTWQDPRDGARHEECLTCDGEGWVLRG